MIASPITDIGVGELSRPLRALVEAQLARTEAVAERTLQAMREAIPDYRHIDDTALALDVRQSVTHNVQLWFNALLVGHAPTPEDLAPLMDFGRRRVHQGMSLQSLLQAFRTGSRVLWDVLLEQAADDAALHRELLFKVSPYILLHFDLMGRTVGQAYAEEQQHRARWRDRLQHELCGVIFSHPDDATSFREHAMALGIESNAAHLALAVRLTAPASERGVSDAGLDLLLASLARALAVDRGSVLHTLRNGHLLLWLPLRVGDSPSEGERSYALQCEELLRGAPEITALGLGLPGSGARGWRRSAEQALLALDLGLRLEPAKRVQRYLDVALDDALNGSENVARYLASLLDRLAPEPHLLKTLQAFFEHRQHRKAVAGALNIHPNTLSYRLERIESLLAARLDEVVWMSRLHSALRLRELGH